MNFEDIIFPHKNIRREQDKIITQVIFGLNTKKRMIFHAPTGLGKTSATLAPAINYAIENKKKVLFLTTKNTQHKIVLETVRLMNKKTDKKIIVSDLIGKRWMCSLDDLDNDSNNGEFLEFCRKLRKDKKCPFFNKTYKKQNSLSDDSKSFLHSLLKETNDAHQILQKSKQEGLCGYEIAIAHSKNSDVIVADYHYLFSPEISDAFFNRMQNELKDFIVIVDEAHNLIERLKTLASNQTTTNIFNRAISEAEKFGFNNTVEILSRLKLEIFAYISKLIFKNYYYKTFNEFERIIHSDIEITIEKDHLIAIVNKIINYNELITNLEDQADIVREKNHRSYLGSISNFFESWKEDNPAFLRYFTFKENIFTKENLTYLRDLFKKELMNFNINSIDKDEKVELIVDLILSKNLEININCLDPSIISKPIIDGVENIILMSGTLTPTKMYSDLLGFDETKLIEKEFESPFPKKNREFLFSTDFTTKFTSRNNSEYEKIAKFCYELHSINKNGIFFFPSYFLLNEIYSRFVKYNNQNIFEKNNKKLIIESRDLRLNDKNKIIDDIKNSITGRKFTLFAVSAGNFSEGIDMPHAIDIISIIGLPLAKPNLLTKSTINYYNNKFSKGWDYAYIIPAINKILQAAGRAIRTEKDKGIILFCDNRFPDYKKYFPKDYEFKIVNNNEQALKEINFFYS